MRSLWLTAARAPVSDGELPAGADVVVAGGGLLGVWCAYWLARKGVNVVVLEQNTLASGATGRNSGLVIPTTAEPYDQAVRRLGAPLGASVRRLAVSGACLLGQVIDDERISCRYRPGGFVELALDDGQAARCRAEIAVTAEHGFEAAWLDRDAVQSCVATRLRDGIPGAMLQPGAMVNSVALVEGLATAARRHGARFFTGVSVTELEANGRSVLVRTSGGALRAATVVSAVNAWLGGLVPALHHVVRPVQGQMIATSPLPQVFPCGMAAQLTSHGEYWQQLPGGTILLGGCRAAAPPPADPLAQRPQPAVHQALQRVLPTLFPDLGRVEVKLGWAGAMAFTPDRIPIVHEVAESVWAVGGFCGHGMPFGASISKVLAAHIIDGEPPAELAHLRLDRPTLAQV